MGDEEKPRDPLIDVVLGAGVTCIAGGVVFFFSQAGMATLNWKPEVWAAWVQAVGSVAAIVAAIVIAGRQERHSERARADEAQKAERRALAFARQAVHQARTSVDAIHTQLTAGKFNRDLCTSLMASAGGLLNECLRVPVPIETIDSIWLAKRTVDRIAQLALEPVNLVTVDSDKVLRSDRQRLAEIEVELQRLVELLIK